MSRLATKEAEVSIRRRHGDYGVAWLRSVDSFIYKVASSYGVTELSPLTGGTMCVVAVGTSASGDRLVFKANPDHTAAEVEVAFLRDLKPFAPEVARGAENGLFVMAYVDARPEAGSLRDKATSYILPVLRNIATSSPTGSTLDPAAVVMKARDRLAAYDSSVLSLFDSARLLPRLLSSLQEDTLVRCHGDLNSTNTLIRSDGGSLTILDPSPVVAPVAYDAGYWATCPYRTGDLVARLAEIEAALPSRDLVAWATLGAALHLTYHAHYMVSTEMIKPARQILIELLSL